VYEKEVKIYKNRDCFPRLFFVPTFRYRQGPQSAYEAIGRSTAEDFMKSVVLESLPPSDYLEDDSLAEELPRATIKLVTYQPNRIEADISTSRKGFIVISDTYHPGWRAQVDGHEVPVLRANYIMRAVPVPEGDHRLTLRFQPRLLVLGAVITAVGWFVLGILLLILGAAGIRRRVSTT
jgi:hypothetical protein